MTKLNIKYEIVFSNDSVHFFADCDYDAIKRAKEIAVNRSNSGKLYRLSHGNAQVDVLPYPMGRIDGNVS